MPTRVDLHDIRRRILLNLPDMHLLFAIRLAHRATLVKVKHCQRSIAPKAARFRKHSNWHDEAARVRVRKELEAWEKKAREFCVGVMKSLKQIQDK